MLPPSRLLLVCLVVAGTTLAVPVDQIYPFGREYGDAVLPPGDEGSSPEFELAIPIKFYNEVYTSLYVGINGLISFLTEIPAFYNMQFPLEYPVIAPLYTDVDTTGGGSVYYRETSEPTLLRRATEIVRYSFSRGNYFQAASLFIATWADVGYFDGGSDKANTYQTIIASDNSSSYVFMLYADQGIQWIQGKGKGSRPDARAQAGLMAHDGRMVTLRGSGTDQVQNLDKWTNFDEPGFWIFYTGPLQAQENIAEPDLVNSYTPQGGSSSCSYGAAECHSKAECVNYPNGYCCICQEGFYGNGKNCLQDDVPLRVNGKVTGTLNGIRLEELDVQCYVVTTDTRAYTAISKVPEELGYDMQSLNILGTSLGWLFAKPIKSAKNGYELTGGVYNHTSTIFFSNTGHRVTVIQRFLGLDVFDQLKTEIIISGTIPSIPADNRIESDDFEEKYTRTGPGVVKAHYTREIKIGGDNGQPIQFVADQTIEFEECAAQESDVSTLRLKFSRNYILYEAREKIVRYAMTSKVSPLGDDDPCKESKVNCGANSVCIVENDDAKCVCEKGYKFLFDIGISEPQCVDINECQSGQHHCHHNAICINEPGAYRCQCKSGFRGDGHICERLPTCKEAQCHPNAECIEKPTGIPECRCRSGFRGNGLQCEPEFTGESCNTAHNCSPYATCKFSHENSAFKCVCIPGYHGDGYACESNSNYKYIDPNAPNPDCDQDECECPEGYIYGREVHRCLVEVGSVTQDQDEIEEPSCDESIYLCHANARCVFNYAIKKHECQCNAGYEGDGSDCTEIELSCQEVDICHVNASCKYNERIRKYLCECNRGFEGDGTRSCISTGNCISDSDCGRNAQCIFDAGSRLYNCICNAGFRGDGQFCEDDREATCRQCHENAECLFMRDLNQYRCECLPGYLGDGRQRCEKEKSGCNVLNDCGRNAECFYNPYDSTHKCRCKDGFSGDGYWCVPQITCDQDQSICHEEAKCIPDPFTRQYVCRCNDGFTGDGFSCKLTKSHEGDFLLVNQGMATLRIPFKPTHNNRGRIIQIHYFQTAVGIDIDCHEGRFYWSDINGKAIRSAGYNGANSSRFAGPEIESPEGIAIDWVSRNIFWTDSALNQIAVASLDKTENKKVLISENLINPRGIALYPSFGKIFWSDWNRESPKIEVANMDGTGRSIFVRDNIQLPNSLAVDAERDELCWADAGTKKIECIGVRNGYRRTVVSECKYPFSLAISNTHYYWTDWETKKVEAALRPNGQRVTALDVPLGSSGNLFGAVVVPDSCPVFYTTCQSQDACPEDYICLPNGKNGRSCLCPDYPEDEEDTRRECNDLI
ncbi:nidogen [Neocloeon triangulifer]|uniref:nidogen n=1 Tax=Neocloeon triangulifer TaxID=2078957 RepID=UPI00286F90B8|nr:nidogen [Neocloeon triangulifer]